MAVEEIVNYPDPPLRDRTSLLQLLYGALVNLSLVNTGLAFGFSAVALPQFDQLSQSDASWIASAVSLSPPAGCMLAGYLTDRFGRRIALILAELPFILGSVLLALADTTSAMIAGRLIAGVGCGMVMTPVRVYCSEMSLPNMRGLIGAFPCAGHSLGVVIQACLGMFLHWRWLCWFSAAWPTIVALNQCFLPESPYFLLMKGDFTGAESNLNRFRSKKYNVDAEMQEMIEFKRVNHIVCLKFKDNLRHLFQRSSCKPFGIIGTYFAITQLSGVTVITFYAVDIFKRSGSRMDAHTGNIVLAVTRLASAVLASVLHYRLGRRSLTFVSSIGCGVCFTLVGVYVWLMDAQDGDVEFEMARSWIPSACCVLYVIFSTVGYLIIPFLLIGELYPMQIRGTLGGLSVTLSYLFIFVAVYTYPYMIQSVGFRNTFLFYGTSSILGSIFFYLYLPETKDLTLQEIEQFYNGRVPTLASERMLLARSVASRSIASRSGPSVPPK